MESCVVVGGGLGGIVAARRLLELGLVSIVLEKGAVDGGLGNARISGGLIHLAWGAMDEGPEQLLARLNEETGNEIDPELARVLADTAGRAVSWMAGQGVEMRAKSDVVYQRHALYPHRPGTGRRIRPEFGPDLMISTLYRNVREAGSSIVLGAAVTDIAPIDGSDDWVVRYRASGTPNEVRTKTVVIADGGFQGNPEMLERYVGPNAGLCALRAMTSATGDGLRLLLMNGAGATGLGRVYGHMLSHDALASDELWPYPAMDKLCLDGALVDRGGSLIDHAASTGVELVTLLARSEDPRGLTLIFDDDLWQTAGKNNPYNTAVPNPDLVERGGHFVSAESIRELADELGIAPTALARAVDAHNEKHRGSPVAGAPFHAARVIPGITFTMGGARVNSQSAVLSRDGEPIPGLYAVGSTVGGIHGGPRGGYVGGLAVALQLGLIAAESIASSIGTAANSSPLTH